MSGITRDVPITIDKIKVHLDFHVYDILSFDLLLGYPLEKLLASHGSLDEMLRENTSATTTPFLENPLAKLLPEQNPLEEMMHTSPFYHPSLFSWKLQNLLKSATWKIPFTFVKTNDHHYPRPSLSLLPLAQSMLFSTMIEIQL